MGKVEGVEMIEVKEQFEKLIEGMEQTAEVCELAWSYHQYYKPEIEQLIEEREIG